MIHNAIIGGWTNRKPSAIIVFAPTGSKVSAKKGDEARTVDEISTGGAWVFRGCDSGEWEVTVTRGDDIHL